MFLTRFLAIAALIVIVVIFGYFSPPPESETMTQSIPSIEENVPADMDDEKTDMLEKAAEGVKETAQKMVVPNPAVSETQILESLKEPAAAETETAGYPAALIDNQAEEPINFSSIVAVQCVWDYTLPENVAEDPRFHAENYFQTSGTIISKNGLILTVNHLLDTGLDEKPDPTGKKWFLKECEAAQTNEGRLPIRYDSPRFKKVETVFRPSQEEYDYESNNRIDFDFALLKFADTGTYPHTSILESLIYTEEKDVSMLLAGYPGAALTGQRKFTTIDFFSDLQKYRGRKSGVLAIFYEAGSRHYTAASESYKNFQEELFVSGVDNRLVRGGFSGSPVFVKGYLAGITISSSLPYQEQEDIISILSSYSIVELLKKRGFALD